MKEYNVQPVVAFMLAIIIATIIVTAARAGGIPEFLASVAAGALAYRAFR